MGKNQPRFPRQVGRRLPRLPKARFGRWRLQGTVEILVRDSGLPTPQKSWLAATPKTGQERRAKMTLGRRCAASRAAEATRATPTARAGVSEAGSRRARASTPPPHAGGHARAAPPRPSAPPPPRAPPRRASSRPPARRGLEPPYWLRIVT